MSGNKDMNTGTKMDLRIRRTRSAIRDAFISLMREKDFSAITVTDISERADINRKTFYAHYDTKEHLLAQLLLEMYQDIIGTLMYTKQSGSILPDLAADLTAFFSKAEAYRMMIDALITSQTSGLAFSLADEVILSGMARAGMVHQANDVIERELYVSRIKNFLFTSIDWWMDHSGYTPSQAAALYTDMMRLSLADVFGY